ncbi:MAG: DEAD/DEAH box helicase [Planctomycetes bacterium]|nr:DEAD/DEAH box helicase [Planctomycetota bacterium]
MKSFSELALIEPLQQAIRDSGYVEPTPIQVQAIPVLLQGKDLLGCAKTGTGKTAAFALPILQRLSTRTDRPHARSMRTLVIVPTRELAAQVAESFKTYGARLRLSVAVIFGGVGQGPQVRALARGVDVLVATPGRLLDLKSQGHIDLGRVEVLVLDEADQMLDMGFIPDVRRILGAVPRKRQTLLFSATMPPTIAQLAESILSQPVKVTITPPASTVELIEQSVYFVTRSGKPSLLAKLLSKPEVGRALVFTRTKRGADRVAKRLTQDGLPAHAIHGNKSQGQRERTLDSFREGRSRILVATDIAARGIDIDAITHVVNYEIPNVAETYVHRIGRTGRAGATGIAISLCDAEERAYVLDIERLIKRSIPVAGHAEDHQRERAHPKRVALAAATTSNAPRAARRATQERAPTHAPSRGSHAPRERSHGAPHAHGGRTPSAGRAPHAGTRAHEPRKQAPKHPGATHAPKHHAPRPTSGSSKPHSPRPERAPHSGSGFGAGI